MAKKSAGQDINNQDILAYALYRLDGAGKFVDVEEIIEECFRLSPSRFGWRTKATPSDRTGWHALGDFEKTHPEMMLKTENGLGRQLSGEGVEWIRSRLEEFEALASRKTRAPKTRRASYRIIAELERQPWTKAFLQGSRVDVSKVEAADMLNCAPDSPRRVWQTRLATLRAAAVDNERSDILELLDFLQKHNSSWFEEVR